jgi:hypothetical protein
MNVQTPPGAPAPAIPSTIETVRAFFGEHPEDVISPIGTGRDFLGYLGALFSVIARPSKPNEPAEFTEIRNLAKLGQYVADDIANYLRYAFEEKSRRIKAAEAREGGAA